MYAQVEKPKENQSRSIANSVTQKRSDVKQDFGFVDNRPEAIARRKNFSLSAPIQFFQAFNLEGALDDASYEKRAASESQGFNGFGEDNLARATIILDTGMRVTIFAFSQYGNSHSEEKLIANIVEKYGAEILNRDPAVDGQTRIVEVYTERAPCELVNAEPARRQRQETCQNCQAYLTRILHPNVRVSHSVPNNSNGHSRLMQNAKKRYISEVVRDQKRVTYQNATNRSVSYLKEFRNACFKQYKQCGRNYFSEAQETKKLIQRFRATVETFGLHVDFYNILTSAFESIPHYNGQNNESVLVKQALNEAAVHIEQLIKEEMAAIQEYAAHQEETEEEQRMHIIARMQETESSEIVSKETGIGEEEILEIWNTRNDQ